jgi:tetratricopeptide (TPR) repeat protein
MIRNLYLIFVVIIFSNFILAQKDSTFQNISKMPKDVHQIFAWINAANEISVSNPLRATSYIEEALKLSYNLDNIRGEAYAYNSFGALYYTLEKYDKSIQYFEKAITLFDGLENEKGHYSSMKYIGSAYEKNKAFKKAISYYNKFLKLAEKNKNDDDIVFAKNGLARCNQALDNEKESETYYQQVYEIETQRNNAIGKVNAADNLGNFYESINDSVKAFSYFDSSQTIVVANQMAQQSNNYFTNTNNFYQKRGNIDQQIQVNQSAIVQNEALNNPKGVNEANLQLGKLNLQKKNNKEAITYLRNSINLSEELGELTVKEEALQAITEAYKDMGNYKEALLAFEKLVILQDSIQQEKNKQMLTAQNLSLELEQKDKQIDLMLENEKLKEEKYNLELSRQANENKQKNNVILALMIGILVLFMAAFIVVRSNKERARANMLLELKSLRTQMNPHFIFNSLNSVNSFISNNDERSANKYLSRFSQLMRLVLENSKSDFVSLESEVKILKLYMELEHLRFSDKFDYELDVDESINLEDVDIPPMLVQPYIENAIWHGLRYLDKKGFLKVKIVREKFNLVWTITDNGIGRDASESFKTQNQKMGSSTGMKNIQQRIEILNLMHGLELSSEINDLDKGTQVIIKIPV